MVCFCLPENAETCPMRKDRSCEEGILDVSFESLSAEEINLIRNVQGLSDTVRSEYHKVKAASTRFNKGLADIQKSLKNLRKR